MSHPAVDVSSNPSASSPAKAGAALSDSIVSGFRDAFENEPAWRVSQNALTQTTLEDLCLNRRVVTQTDHSFSHVLDDWEVTNQKRSGRCWMFAGLNLFRVGAMKAMNLKSFEFSQNHTLFWDKLERANYFLEAIIETAAQPLDDRTVAFLLDRPLEDGGQWNMFANIIRKHGLVPKSAMPESQSSSDTLKMNQRLTEKLREGAMILRETRAAGAPMEAVRAAKLRILEVAHRILCIHLGTPPREFNWQWSDKDKKFNRDGTLTPQEFAKKYLTLPLDEYICLVHDPRNPRNRTYTVKHLGNVVEGGIVKYLNIEIELMKQIAMQAIVGGEPVWMGCDVGKMMRRDMGLWDAELFEYGPLYGTSFPMNKEQRLVYHQTRMNHAMLFTGVDVVDGPRGGRKPRKWRVENSWGADCTGEKGFFVMNDSWFDEHMFEIAARKSALPPELIKALDAEPIVLPPWDPMGALAGRSPCGE